jgi:hypothetical protein
MLTDWSSVESRIRKEFICTAKVGSYQSPKKRMSNEKEGRKDSKLGTVDSSESVRWRQCGADRPIYTSYEHTPILR